MTINNQQILLAEQAAQGQVAARKEVSLIVDPIVSFQTQRFCKRFCKEHRFRYSCTLPQPNTGCPADAPLCEWGNASYGWMLHDLTHEKRLRKFSGANGAKIYDYAFSIANSLPFYERWKDWRFNRRIHVPTYIQNMAPHAKDIFYGLRQAETLESIAQRLQQSIPEVSAIASKIMIELTKRNRLHILQIEKTVSLSAGGMNDEETFCNDIDIAIDDQSAESLESREQLHKAWNSLSSIEQYILEALLIEEQDANDILAALKSEDIRLNPDVPAADTNRQQLYYFRRKTLAKLRERMSVEGDSINTN
ncbi:MAG: hypothetical protein ACC707_02750 [Thiohalomonadales bacterium]